jgi:hypothetical protein
MPSRRDLYFGRHNLEVAKAARFESLFAIGVDRRFDRCPGVRCLDDLTIPRRAASPLRKVKPRSVAAGDRDLPRCDQGHVKRKFPTRLCGIVAARLELSNAKGPLVLYTSLGLAGLAHDRDGARAIGRKQNDLGAPNVLLWSVVVLNHGAKNKERPGWHHDP